MLTRAILTLLRGVPLAALVFAVSCGERIVQHHEAGQARVSLQLHPHSASLLAAASQFRLFVTSTDGNDTLASGSLVWIGAYIEGRVDALPAGIPLLVTVEALESTGTVLYRGDTLVTIAPNLDNEVTVSLHPVVPLVKFTPHYAPVATDSAFNVAVSVFGVPDLFGVTFRVFWDPRGMLLPGAASLGSGLPPGEVIFFDTVDVQIPAYVIAISQTPPRTVLVDNSGQAELADIAFTRSALGPFIPDTLRLQITAMTRFDGSSIDPLNVYTDICVADTLR